MNTQSDSSNTTTGIAKSQISGGLLGVNLDFFLHAEQQLSTATRLLRMQPQLIDVQRT